MDNFTRGYIETGCWADGGNIDIDALPDDVRVRAIKDCERFQVQNEALLYEYYAQVSYDPAQGVPRDAYAGHDFYLTRQGHGAGFWDRGLGELGIKLTDAAHAYGSIDDFTMLNEDQSND